MIGRSLSQFSLFMGVARLRALFTLIGLTGLLSLMLNAVEGAWVIPVQSALVIIAIVGSAAIIISGLEAYERGRWMGLLLPAFGAVLLGFFVLPQFLLPLTGAGVGWVIAGLLVFRSRAPMEYQKAVRHLRKSDYGEAVKIMDGLVKNEPNTLEHLRFRAELLRLWGKLDRAKRDYRTMTEIDADSALAFNGLAEVCLQSGHYDEALVAAQRAAELAPQEWVALYNLGMIEDRLGASDQGAAQLAITHLEKALALKVPDARHRLLIHLYLARAHARLGAMGDAQEAVADLRKHKVGLSEWETILKSEQAETLRAVIGDDIETANGLISGELDVTGMIPGRIA